MRPTSRTRPTWKGCSVDRSSRRAYLRHGHGPQARPSIRGAGPFSFPESRIVNTDDAAEELAEAKPPRRKIGMRKSPTAHHGRGTITHIGEGKAGQAKITVRHGPKPGADTKYEDRPDESDCH